MTKRRKFSDAERMALISEYLQSGESKSEFQAKRRLGHSAISNWMLNFGISKPQTPTVMAKGQTPATEDGHLKEEIERLRKELEYEKLRSLAFETMIEIAETELKIDIRKKSGAKQ